MAAALEICGRVIQNETFAVMDTLAGDYSQAVDNEQRALAAMPKEIKDPNRAREFQQKATERLQLFEQRQPCHAPPEAR